MKKLLILISICGFVLSCNSNGKIEKLVVEDVKEAAGDAWLFKERNRQIEFFNARFEEWYEEHSDDDGDVLIVNNYYDIYDVNVILDELGGYMGILGQLASYEEYEDDPDCFKKDFTHYSQVWIKDAEKMPSSQKDYYDDQIFYNLWYCCVLDEGKRESYLLPIATFIHGRAWTEVASYTPNIKGMEQLSSPEVGAYWRTETNNGVYFTKLLKGEDGKYTCRTVDSLEKLNE